jgi:hypothetical protein
VQTVEHDAVGARPCVTRAQAANDFGRKRLTLVDEQEVIPVRVSLRDVKHASHGTWNALNT